MRSLGLSNLHLPKLKPSSANFGQTNFDGLLPTPLAINSMIGDSHAAAFGECCFSRGTAKATMGTGCSIIMNIGDRPTKSTHGMVTTICWSTHEQVKYALEGVIVSCGSTLEWLKNELQLFRDSRETEALANSVEDSGGVYLIPAFSGLGAPYWDMNRKASLTGLTFGTHKNHVVRAALESIPFQIKDVIAAMESDTGVELHQLMVDGGVTSNQFVMRFLADLMEKPVVNIGMADVSALGAAYMAGLQSGIFKNLDQLAQISGEKKVYHPSGLKLNRRHEEWKKAINNS
jgi:glycerol kinase